MSFSFNNAALANSASFATSLNADFFPGGKTPVKSTQVLQSLGYSIVIFPGGTVRAVANTLQQYYGSLKQTGSTQAFQDRMLDFDGLNNLIGTPELLARGKRYESGEH